MANTIKIKQSSTASNVPTAGQLQQGELAINTADEKLYSKNSSNVIFEVGGVVGTTTFISATEPGGWVEGDIWIETA